MENYKGSNFIQVNNNITLGCISPEARDLLDTAMAEWEKHKQEKKKRLGKHYRRESVYGFAYWLIRWSGLVRPTQ